MIPLQMDPTAISIESAVSVLTTLGVLPVITFAALIGLASTLYRRFRR